MVEMSKAKAEPRALPRRFYAAVSLQQNADGFAVLLDGKELKTQGRKAMRLASQNLAEAVVAEWEAQRDVINPDRMPLTRLVNLAIDRMALDRLAVLEQIAAYGETDLICYRAPDAVLRPRQDAAFDPLLAWIKHAYNITLLTTDGVMPVVQSTVTLEQFRALFAAASDAELAALAMLVPLLGSAVMTLALWKHAMTVDDALKAARLDEDFQAEKWGADPEQTAAWEHKCRDIRAAAFFLTCK